MAINKDTLIIIISFSCLGTISLLFLLVKLIRQSRKRSNPLPPPQPLAHHRERELAKFSEALPRSQTWYQPGQLSPPTIASSSSALGSKASLLGKGSPSLSATDLQESLSLDSNHSLPLPNPSFHSRPGSSLSSGSSSDLATPPSPRGRLGTPPLPSEGSISPRTRSRMPSSSSSSPSRRPMSVSSSHSTLYSRTGKPNAMRGSPHGPRSQIQIVLPAPLAPDLSTSAAGTSSSLHSPGSRMDVGEGYDRRSIVDKWVSSPSLRNSPPVPLNSQAPTGLLVKHQQSARSTPSLATRSASTVYNSSASPASLTPSTQPSSTKTLPPVPQVPPVLEASSDVREGLKPPGLTRNDSSADVNP